MTTEEHTHEDQPQDFENASNDPLANVAGETLDSPEDQSAEELDPMAALEQERDQLMDQLRRVSADYQNYMKRSEERLHNMIEYARGDLLRSFIPIMDHFDRALQTTEQSENTDDESYSQGIRILRDEFLNIIQQAGVSIITPEVGDPFNPEEHEAMLRQPADDIPPNHITLSLQAGYVYKERVIRPAQVAVAPEE